MSQPFLAGDASLFQKALEKARPDVAFVFVGNDERQVAALHLLMFAADKRPRKTKFVEPLDEFPAGDGRQFRHGRERQCR